MDKRDKNETPMTPAQFAGATFAICFTVAVVMLTVKLGMVLFR